MKKDSKMHLEIDNLAIPEVRLEEMEETEFDDEDDEIDYSGAIPEIHIFNKKDDKRNDRK